MTQDGPGYYYVTPRRGDDWQVWMWTGHTWYEPGELYAKEPPFWCSKVPQPPRPADPDHWHVSLDGYGDREKFSGDVISKDGEVLGTWVLDPEGHPGFIPLGETEEVISSFWIGEFCKLIKEWHEEREAARLSGLSAPA